MTTYTSSQEVEFGENVIVKIICIGKGGDGGCQIGSAGCGGGGGLAAFSMCANSGDIFNIYIDIDGNASFRSGETNIIRAIRGQDGTAGEGKTPGQGGGAELNYAIGFSGSHYFCSGIIGQYADGTTGGNGGKAGGLYYGFGSGGIGGTPGNGGENGQFYGGGGGGCGASEFAGGGEGGDAAVFVESYTPLEDVVLEWESEPVSGISSNNKLLCGLLRGGKLS